MKPLTPGRASHCARFYDIAPQVIGKSYTPNLYVYNLAFADQRLNYAAALSFLLGAVVFIVSFIVMRISTRQERMA